MELQEVRHSFSFIKQIDMATDHPFQHLFETLGRVPTSHAEPVNRQAYEILSSLLAVPVEKSGRCILLRAPRGGHGKTHLLSRIQYELGIGHEFIPLQPVKGCQIDATTVTDDVLRRLLRQVPGGAGLTVLDELTRRLFAVALQPLVISGDVPCQDRDGALTALRQRPVETFDFHHPSAVTAHWALENSEVLGQRLASELAQRSGLAFSGIAFWVEALFRFAAAPLDNSSRVKALLAEVHGAPNMDREHLESLLGLLTQLIRVVLVADDVEGFSTDEPAALRFAAFLGSLRHSVERVDVILSLNQDIWASAFLPRLSSGLTDRLTEVIVDLAPLTEAEMAALLDSRVPGLGSRLLGQIDLTASGNHARGLIRAAGLAWLKATTLGSRPALAVTPSPESLSLANARLPHEPPPLPVWEPEAEEEAAPEAEVTIRSEPEVIPEPLIELKPEPEAEIEPEIVEKELIAEIIPEIDLPPLSEILSESPPSEVKIPAADVASFWPVPILSQPVVTHVPLVEFVPEPVTPLVEFVPEPVTPLVEFVPTPTHSPLVEFVPTPTPPPVVVSPFTVVAATQIAPLTPLVGQVVPVPIPVPQEPVITPPPVEFVVVPTPLAEVAAVPVPPVEAVTVPAPPAEAIAQAEPAALEAPDADHLDSLLRRFRERFRGDS